MVEFLIKLTILPQNFVYAVRLYNKFITNNRDKHSWREPWYGLSSPTALDQSENEKLIQCGNNSRFPERAGLQMARVSLNR